MIKREAFNYLAICFEGAMDRLRSSELKVMYPHLWEDLINSGALQPKGIASDRLIMIENGDDDSGGYREVFQIEGRYVYFDEMFNEVTDDDLRMYQFRMSWFPEWLCAQLQLGSPTPIMDDRVWLMGEQQGVTVLLVRSLRRDFDEIADFIEERNFNTTLIISRSQPQSKRIQLPKGCQIVPLKSLIPPGPQQVDRHHFLSYINPDQARLEREGILWDEDAGVLKVLGHEPWVQKSAPDRCQLVDLLFRAGQYGSSPKVYTGGS